MSQTILTFFTLLLLYIVPTFKERKPYAETNDFARSWSTVSVKCYEKDHNESQFVAQFLGICVSNRRSKCMFIYLP